MLGANGIVDEYHVIRHVLNLEAGKFPSVGSEGCEKSDSESESAIQIVCARADSLMRGDSQHVRGDIRHPCAGVGQGNYRNFGIY